MMIMIKCCHDDYYGDATETNVTMMMIMKCCHDDDDGTTETNVDMLRMMPQR